MSADHFPLISLQ